MSRFYIFIHHINGNSHVLLLTKNFSEGNKLHVPKTDSYKTIFCAISTVLSICLFNFLLSCTDKNLNSRSVNDSQGLVRTCQVLDQSLHAPHLALPVLGSPGAKNWNTEKSKTDSGHIRAE